MSPSAERILESFRALTPDERQQVLEALSRGDKPQPGACAEVVERVFGQYASVATSSDAFCARKADEISWEDRRHRP